MNLATLLNQKPAPIPKGIGRMVTNSLPEDEVPEKPQRTVRRCAQCGHVGCCDTSPNQHAKKHFHTTGHPVMQSYEPRENWFWDFTTNRAFAGPKLAEPRSHPADQAIPGPAGRVPADWESQLNE